MKEIKITTKSSDNLSELVYQRIKNDIFDFKLMPGERFTESEVAKAYDVSRTPIRQALYRLQQEGYVDVSFRSGWQVRPLNFRYYEELYDVRIVLEKDSIRKLCQIDHQNSVELSGLKDLWLIEPHQYLKEIITQSTDENKKITSKDNYTALVIKIDNSDIQKAIRLKNFLDNEGIEYDKYIILSLLLI